MGPEETTRNDTRSFLFGNGMTRLLTVFQEKLLTRPKAVFTITRRALATRYAGHQLMRSKIAVAISNLYNVVFGPF